MHGGGGERVKWLGVAGGLRCCRWSRGRPEPLDRLKASSLGLDPGDERLALRTGSRLGKALVELRDGAPAAVAVGEDDGDDVGSSKDEDDDEDMSIRENGGSSEQEPDGMSRSPREVVGDNWGGGRG